MIGKELIGKKVEVENMNKMDIFDATLTGKIDSKNYKKFKLSKTQFYKVYSRVRFYQKLNEPIKLCILNLSQREFSACLNSKLKSEIPGKSKPPEFIERGKNKPNDAGSTSE